MPKNQLGKVHRLISPSDFQQIFKQGKKFRQQGISLFVCTNALTDSRFGIVVPKKQIPLAVDRNRIKRIIREFFRIRKNDLTSCLDMVFVVYSGLLESSNTEINACLEDLWLKVARYYNKV